MLLYSGTWGNTIFFLYYFVFLNALVSEMHSLLYALSEMLIPLSVAEVMILCYVKDD